MRGRLKGDVAIIRTAHRRRKFSCVKLFLGNVIIRLGRNAPWVPKIFIRRAQKFIRQAITAGGVR